MPLEIQYEMPFGISLFVFIGFMMLREKNKIHTRLIDIAIGMTLSLLSLLADIVYKLRNPVWLLHTQVNLIYVISCTITLMGIIGLLEQRNKEENHMAETIKYYLLGSAGIMVIATLFTQYLENNMIVLLDIWYIAIAGTTVLYPSKKSVEKGILALGILGRGITFGLLQTMPLGTIAYAISMICFIVFNNIMGIGCMLIIFDRSKEAGSQKGEMAEEILKSTNIVIAKIDCEGNISYINDAVERILGYELENANMKRIQYVVHCDDQDKAEALKGHLNVGYAPAHFEIRLKHKKGYYVWMDLHVTPLLNKDGIKAGNIVCAANITEEKEMSSKLKKSENRFYQLFQGIEDAIFIQPFGVDYMNSPFFEVNQAASEKFGYTKEEYNTLSLAMLDKKLANSPMDKHLMKALLEEGKVIYETTYLTKDKQEIPVEVTAHMFVLDHEKTLMTVVRDISERNIIKRSRELEKAKSDFLANISHELRTPLNVIITTLQLFELVIKKSQQGRTCAESERVEKYIQIMKQNGLRLLKLVNNFVCMAKIEAGYYVCNKKPCNIISLVEDIADSVITYIEGSGLTFEFDTDSEEKIVSCDPEMIEKIILNLIANAVKFTEPGGKIKIYIEDLGNQVKINVKDNGMGISEEKQDVIFERFKQAEKTFTRKTEGCGIGLSLVKSFVEMQGGTIKVKSQKGAGTTFSIVFPVEKDVDPKNIFYQMPDEENSLYRLSVEFSDIYKKQD